MRIALVIEHFAPGAGGGENVAWRVAHGLQQAGDAARVRFTGPQRDIATVYAAAVIEDPEDMAEAHGRDAHPKAPRALFERVRP